METLEITKDNAVKAYKEGDSHIKCMLETLFGKKVFPVGKITDRVKTYPDACEVLGLNPLDERTDRSSDEIAYIQLKTIAKALNEGWEPDWNNSNEYKYYPYFKMKAGFGFSFTYCVYDFSFTVVGSRLCFKTQELAEYAGKQFESIYNDFLTIKK